MPQPIQERVVRLPFKIFQIGFNKCGTHTIHSYFEANGIKSIHRDDGRLAQQMFRNLSNGEDLLHGYEQFDAFTDMEYIDGQTYLEAYKLFPYLASQYPESVFILNTREPNAWIKSRFGHGGGRLAQLHRAYYNVTSDQQLIELWRCDWNRHQSRVLDFFSGRSHRFFVCNIETDLPHLLNSKIPELSWDSSQYGIYRAKKRGLNPKYKMVKRSFFETAVSCRELCRALLSLLRSALLSIFSIARP